MNENINNTITKEHIEKYIEISRKALKKAKIAVPKKTHFYKIAEDALDMAKRYIEDAEHFKNKKDYVRALSAVNYAHGWLDSIARQGYINVDYDSTLFTIDDLE